MIFRHAAAIDYIDYWLMSAATFRFARFRHNFSDGHSLDAFISPIFRRHFIAAVFRFHGAYLRLLPLSFATPSAIRRAPLRLIRSSTIFTTPVATFPPPCRHYSFRCPPLAPLLFSLIRRASENMRRRKRVRRDKR
jgi:hypothetical protein